MQGKPLRLAPANAAEDVEAGAAKPRADALPPHRAQAQRGTKNAIGEISGGSSNDPRFGVERSSVKGILHPKT